MLCFLELQVHLRAYLLMVVLQERTIQRDSVSVSVSLSLCLSVSLGERNFNHCKKSESERDLESRTIAAAGNCTARSKIVELETSCKRAIVF